MRKAYEASHHDDGAFLAAVRNGVKSHHWGFGNTSAIEMQTNANIRNGVAYVQALQRENGID